MDYGSLKIKFPNGQTREFELEHPTIFVGQADGNELVLEDRSVSRRHARFSVDSGKLTVEDLGSSNGTLVGDQRLAPNKPGQVSKDQVVYLGQVEIRYIPPDDDDDDSLDLSLAAGVGPGAFQVILENPGNDIKAYALRGGDDLFLLDFKFSPEAVTLQPRQKRTIPLQVTLKSKSQTNPTGLYPFSIIATALDQSRSESKTSGQLIARRGQRQGQGRKLTFAISLAAVMATMALFLFGGSVSAYFVLCPKYFPNVPFCSRPKPTASLTPPPTERPAETLEPTPTTPLRPTAPPVTVIVASPTPPSRDAVSLNCDDTYQRLRSDLGSAQGDQVWVDRWDGQAWVNAWKYAAGDPQIQHIEPEEVGFYSFGACQKLFVLPVRVTGSGAILDLSVYTWEGTTLEQVLSKEGVHGTWSHKNETLIFEESVYLYNEPNCCPCNRQITEEVWDGKALIQMNQYTQPTYTGDPPPECQSSSIPR